MDNKEQELNNIIIDKQQEKTIEIAKKALENNVDIKLISKLTSLTEDEIKNMKN